jgi:hypothetical protein
MMLQACLGLTVEPEGVTLVDPRLPIGIDRLWVDGLEVGGHSVRISVERLHDRIVVETDAPALVKVLPPAGV